MFNLTIKEQAKAGLLSAAQFEIIAQVMSAIWTVVSVFGILANSINIHVFFKMGMADGVTLSFQILSVSDLGFVIIRVMQGISLATQILESDNIVKTYIDPFAVTIFAANVGLMMNLLSTLITTFLAVARCMCVVNPLHFKNDFSKKRSFYVLMSFAIYAMACFIPVFATTGMTKSFDQTTNSSRLILWLSDNRAEVYTVIETMTDLIIPILAQVIIVVCVAVMARALHRANQFRQSLTAENLETPSTEVFSKNHAGKGREASD